MIAAAPAPRVRTVERAMLEVFAQFEPSTGEEQVESLLSWAERRRFFRGEPMHVPGPLREVYHSAAPKLVFMKGAQLGLSEYAINLALWTADTGRAGRGNALYVQPSGENVGDFVQARVNPALEASEYLATRIRPTGSTKDPDKVGLRRIGRGYTYWRTARSRAGLKSVDADTLILDEYDEMPDWSLDMASHRLDSSQAPMTRLISTPTYPGAFIDEEYLAGDQRRYALPCPKCRREQVLEWDKHVVLGSDGTRRRLCADCGASLEAVIDRAWRAEGGEEVGRWVATNPGAPFPSYQLSQLYRPNCDLDAIADGLRSPNITKQQETWNQNLGLPFSPPGGQLSLAELQRLLTAPFSLPDIAGVQGCWMGVDIGARLHVWLSWDDVDGTFGEPQRYLAGALEVDSFDEVGALMRRFGVRICVMDAHPELHSAQAFQLRHPGRVYLATYVPDRMPPAFTGDEEPDPKKRWRVQVDRTAALDAVMARLRGSEVDGRWVQHIAFPPDAQSVPGFFSQLQAPVRRVEKDARGNLKATYDEGSRADHYAHAAVYAELASYVGRLQVQRGMWDARTLSDIGSWDR